MAPDWPRCSQARARHTKQARMLRQPGLPRSTKWIDDAWILLVRECHGDGCAMAHASAKNYSIAFGIFCARECAGSTASRRQRGGVHEGFGTATDQVACRSKSSLRQACRELRALRHLVRLHMLGLGGYGSG